MDQRNNNNVRVKMRRHNSVPVDHLRRRSTLLRRSTQRSNPYVGWFRHAPARMTLAVPPPPKRTPTILTPSSFKNSPHVGWFRHAPSQFSMRERELLFLLRHMPTKQQNQVLSLKDLLSGHLLGGTTTKDNVLQHQTVESLCRHLQRTNAKSNSGTVKVLSRLAYWVLSNFHDSEQDTIKLNKSGSKLDFESSHEEEDYEDNDSFNENEASQHDERFGVSSQAEAYYAHQAAKELDYDDGGEHRLDYVITQMDIIRMQRNASRHLDVESILKLPTITYQAKVAEKQPEAAEGWSWMLVQRGLDVREKEEEQKKQNVCVICLEHFENGDNLRVLPCRHSFHMGCIDRWLSGSHSFDDCFTSGCPTCKKRPDSSDGEVPAWAFTQIGNALSSRDSGHF